MVWGLHVDVNAWPDWQSDITAAHLEGVIERGVSFDWTRFGFSVTSTVYDVSDRARVLWRGTAEGITGVHEWLFSETPAGVHVVTNESFAGDPVSADPAQMQSVLDASLARPGWLTSRRPASHEREDRSASQGSLTEASDTARLAGQFRALRRVRPGVMAVCPPTQRFSDLSPRSRTLVVAVGAVQIALLVAAQVDISRRSASQVRGSKIRWRVLSLINTVGPLAYFRWGRLPDRDGRYGT